LISSSKETGTTNKLEEKTKLKEEKTHRRYAY